MRRLSPFALSAAILLLQQAACSRSESAPRSEPSAAAVSAPATSATPARPGVGAPARTLALAPTPDNTPADRAIFGLARAAEKANRVDAWVVLGQAWVRKARESNDPGYYLNANACVDIALGIEPDSSLALGLRGLVLLNDHKFEEARAVSKRVIESRSDDLLALANLSDALLEMGRFDEAAATAQRMMDLKPNLPAYSRASYFRWLQGDKQGALSNAKSAIASGDNGKDPEPRAWVVVQTALYFWHEGDYEGSIAGCDKALESITDYAPALAMKGKALLSKGDYPKAVEFLARAYALSPLVETAWLLGDAREAAGDTPGAEAAFALVEKQGRLSDPRTLALYWATKDKNKDEALALAEAEIKVRGDVYTHDAHAWALYRAGKFDAAKAASEKALAHGTKDARLLFHAGAIRIAAGDAPGGKKLLVEALKLNPKFDASGVAEAARILR